MSTTNGRFPHHHLLAHELAVQFHRFVVAMRGSMRTGMGDLYDQLERASTSACLDLAEGASAWDPGNKRRYFRASLASMGEAVAALELIAIEIRVEGLIEALEVIGKARDCTSGLLRKVLWRGAGESPGGSPRAQAEAKGEE